MSKKEHKKKKKKRRKEQLSRAQQWEEEVTEASDANYEVESVDEDSADEDQDPSTLSK